VPTPFHPPSFSAGLYYLVPFLDDPLLAVSVTLAVSVVTGGFTWVVARANRKVMIKVGDTEVQGHSVKEVKTLLQLARHHKGRDWRCD
jgi:hypothetical protein